MAPFSFETIEDFGSRIAKEHPDVIGIGPATYNYNQAKVLSDIIKKIRKEVFTIFGGYHVTAVPHEVSEPAIDLAIQGEGEYSFTEVLYCLKKGISYEKIKGISYVKNGKVIVNPRRERIQDLDSIPLPLRNKREMVNYKCKGVYKPATSKQRSVAQVTYSRGCPYSCSYCSSENMWGHAVKYRNPNDVVDEIEYLVDNFGTNLIFFSDLTFNVNRKKVVGLCEAIVNRNIKISWFCGCRPEGIDEDIIKLMKEAGCSRIHFGIETIDEYSLEKIHRKRTFGYTEKALEIASKAGIITRAYLMIGYPWETRANYEIINANLNKLHIDDLRISFFTPFPGTEIFAQHADEIMLKSWDEYTTDKPILSVCDLNQEELLQMRNKIFRDFYGSEEYKYRVQEKMRVFPHLKSSFFEFLSEISTHCDIDVSVHNNVGDICAE